MEAVFRKIPQFFEGWGRTCVFSHRGKVLKIMRTSLAILCVGSHKPKTCCSFSIHSS